MPTKVIQSIVEFFGKKLDHVGVELKGVSVVSIKGDQGEKGDKGEPGEDGRDGLDGNDSKVPGPQGETGEKGVDGKDGKDGTNGADGKDGVDGKKGKDGKDGRDGSPDTGKVIIEKINADTSKEVIKKEKVEGLADIESMARTAEANSRNAMRLGGDTVYIADLSAQTDGIKKTFTIPVIRRSLFVISSDFPTLLMKDNGYTTAGAILTLSTPSAPSSGSQLALLYVI